MAKYYDSISSWVIDTEPDAPSSYTWDEIAAMGCYSSVSVDFIEALIINFCSTGHIRLKDGGVIERRPYSEWDAPPPIEYHNFYNY